MANSASERWNLFKGLAFLSPWLAGFALFMLWPIGLSLYYSFCDYSLIGPGQSAVGAPVFCGWDNYRQLVHDEVFRQVLGNSLLYAALAIPMGLLVALGAAILLNRRVRGQSVFRTFVFLPSLVPTVAAAILWMWLYNQKFGLINYLLSRLDILGPGWLTDVHWVIPSLALVSVWGAGNTVVIYLAALQDVPRELYEAAELDGANALHRLIHVTLPTISPVIFFTLVTAIIAAMQVFDTPFIMTTGGPDRHSYFFTEFLYDEGFNYLHMGYACAIAWIQLLIVLGLTAAAFYSARYWVYYQGK